jgi:hypothetical protein
MLYQSLSDPDLKSLRAAKGSSLYLKIGDKEYNYEDLSKYRKRTNGFEVNYADNGIFGTVEGGPAKVVAERL